MELVTHSPIFNLFQQKQLLSPILEEFFYKYNLYSAVTAVGNIYEHTWIYDPLSVVMNEVTKLFIHLYILLHSVCMAHVQCCCVHAELPVPISSTGVSAYAFSTSSANTLFEYFAIFYMYLPCHLYYGPHLKHSVEKKLATFLLFLFYYVYPRYFACGAFSRSFLKEY